MKSGRAHERGMRTALDMVLKHGNRLLVLGLCVGLVWMWARSIESGAAGPGTRAFDFAQLYYQARCALQHKDAYDPRAVLRVFESEGGKLQVTTRRDEEAARTTITTAVYPPTALLVAAPLAMLSWAVAQAVWSVLMAALLVGAAFLVWNLAADAPALAGGMTVFMLLNCIGVLLVGNPAGVAVSLSVIAAWCFLVKRYELAAVVMLAVGLVIKPQDAGFIWLFFLLAGGSGRKRALQALAVVAVLSACAAIWIAPSSPHWVQELHRNVAADFAHGAVDDPGPTGFGSRTSFPIISLQNAVSVFRDEPHFYNPVSYLIGGGLILVWAVGVVRKRSTREGAMLALAAISFLTFLPVYHRPPSDAKLLLLAIPACAMLWASGGAKRWVALGLTTAAIFVTSDIPLIAWTLVTRKVAASTSTLGGKLTLLALQPAPLVLLAAGCFYLWVYIRYDPNAARLEEEDVSAATAAATAAT